MRPKPLALPLAAFSIGLGLAELLTPRRVEKAAGLDVPKRLIQAYGLRELAAGAMIFAQPKSATPLWMRVAGDFVDLLTIAPATKRNSRSVTAAALVAGVTLLDILTARSLTDSGGGGGKPIHA